MSIPSGFMLEHLANVMAARSASLSMSDRGHPRTLAGCTGFKSPPFDHCAANGGVNESERAEGS